MVEVNFDGVISLMYNFLVAPIGESALTWGFLLAFFLGLYAITRLSGR